MDPITKAFIAQMEQFAKQEKVPVVTFQKGQRKDDVAAAARAFAPGGLDAALMTAGGKPADRALEAMREGGRVAHPNGVQPAPNVRPGVHLSSYDGAVDPKAIEKLNGLIEAGPFDVHVAHTFPLDQAAAAHQALGEHYLGKLALRVS